MLLRLLAFSEDMVKHKVLTDKKRIRKTQGFDILMLMSGGSMKQDYALVGNSLETNPLTSHIHSNVTAFH